ncbi:magnesium transporter [Salinicoccus kekensis]|uniref:Magnesium transporter MgtE n=1 Tax=Salinicoccus kekensis TaxID=714307 RepID=A0A285UW27_9STAP|nr:magnesium transporter [Salinicoccus kekensis]SOC44916.1 Mg2+ transporter MgtE [Salinicoccus kekensis]
MPEIEEMTEIEIEYDALLTQLRDNDIDGFREDFLDLHAYEQSEFYLGLDEADRDLLYEMLSPEEVSMFFDTMEIDDDDSYDALFETMDSRYAAVMIGKMQYDNAADILNELPKSKVTTFLALMDREDAAQIRSLLNYEEDTAGGIMTTEFVSLASTMTVREAMRHLKEVAKFSETIYYVFIVDERRKLAGIMSLRELIVADDDEYIGDIMNERVVSVLVSDDQEGVAQIMRDYDFLALPVLDYQDHLVGIITADDIMDVIDEEASEDYSRLAGMSESESTSDTAVETAKKRLPWLIGLTFMGMITAAMLSVFEDTLAQVVLLSAFIPLISGMAGNTGTQSLAVAVRGISTGEIKESSKAKIAWREIGSGFITGLVCGLVIFVVILMMYQAPTLGLIVCLSLVISMTVATLIGTIVPLFMDKVGIDPAVASGPFITTANDIISLLIYFALANMFMASLLT